MAALASDASADMAGMFLGDSGQQVTYNQAVLGLDPPTSLSSNMTANVSLSASFVGKWSAAVSVSDGCIVTSAIVNITFGCGSPPQLVIANSQV
jgi:hypothetical protein